jgi:hypothetical protein
MIANAAACGGGDSGNKQQFCGPGDNSWGSQGGQGNHGGHNHNNGSGGLSNPNNPYKHHQSQVCALLQERSSAMVHNFH